jgi:hypothetical protein
MKFKFLYKAGLFMDREMNIDETTAALLQPLLNTFPRQQFVTEVDCVTGAIVRGNQTAHYKIPQLNHFVSLVGHAEMAGWPEKAKVGGRRRQVEDIIMQAFQLQYQRGGTRIYEPSSYGTHEYRFYMERNNQLGLKLNSVDLWNTAALTKLSEIIGLEGKCAVYSSIRPGDEVVYPEIIYPHEIRFLHTETGEGGNIICEITQTATIQTFLEGYGFTVLSINAL